MVSESDRRADNKSSDASGWASNACAYIGSEELASEAECAILPRIRPSLGIESVAVVSVSSATGSCPGDRSRNSCTYLLTASHKFSSSRASPRIVTLWSSGFRGSSKHSSKRKSFSTDFPIQRDRGELFAATSSVQVGGV